MFKSELSDSGQAFEDDPSERARTCKRISDKYPVPNFSSFTVPNFSSSHKVFGPETNDLVLQLRKQGIDQVIIAGMSANLCVESHLRELLEQGFEVAVAADATAAAILPGYDGYEAAFVNYRFLASDVWSTDEAVAAIEQSAGVMAAV